MRRRKVYGQSQSATCVFCGKIATTENAQGVNTCLDHKDKSLSGYKCACGEPLDVKKGKYGAFFLCINCGPISLQKGFEMNEKSSIYKTQAPKKSTTQTDDSSTRDFIAREMRKGLPSIDELSDQWD